MKRSSSVIVLRAMKKIKKTAFISLTIIFCLAIHHKECFPANWVHFFTHGKTGAKWYIDVDRIKVDKLKGEIEIYAKSLNLDESYDINHFLINYKEQLASALSSKKYNARGKLKRHYRGRQLKITKEKYDPGSVIQKSVDFVLKNKVDEEKKLTSKLNIKIEDFIVKGKPMPVTKETTAKVLKWLTKALPHLNAGIKLMEAGKYREALVEFNMAIRVAPTYPVPYEQRAKIYLKWKQYDKAWDDVKKCQSLKGIVDPELVKELRKASGREK